MAWWDFLHTRPRRRARAVQAVQAVREAAARRDLIAFQSHLDPRDPVNSLVPDGTLLIELLIEEDPSIAKWLWDEGVCFQHMFAWRSILPALVEHGDRDPLSITEACIAYTTHGNETPVPFAVANMLLRAGRGALAEQVADRWIEQPWPRRAIDLALSDDLDHRQRIRDEMRELFVDEGAPHHWGAILASCQAQCEEDPRYLPRMLTHYDLSPLNSPLIGNVPRPGVGPRALHLVRAHDDWRLYWCLVVAEDEDEARAWGSAWVDPRSDEAVAHRLFDVAASRSGYCFRPSVRHSLVQRPVDGIGSRRCTDLTGLSERRSFHEIMRRTRAEQLAWFSRGWDRHENGPRDEDRDWPLPPEGSPLDALDRQLVQTGLYA